MASGDVPAVSARIQTVEMPVQFALALDNGVQPSELALPVMKDPFEKRQK
jgi:hypothetical protein